MSHTPGPWKADTRFSEVSCPHHIIADVFGANDWDTHLIAAAPDLLAALQAILAVPHIIGFIPSSEVAKAREAIKQATGE